MQFLNNMKKYISITFILLFFIACKSSYYPIKTGQFCFYYSKEKNLKDELILKDDSTFVLTLYGGAYTPTCTGKWKYIEENVIRLECYNETDLLAPITSGYMNLREREVKIINSDKLKMPIENNIKRKYVILRRSNNE